MKLYFWLFRVVLSILLFAGAQVIAAASDSSRSSLSSSSDTETNSENASSSAKKNINTDQSDHPGKPRTSLTTGRPDGTTRGQNNNSDLTQKSTSSNSEFPTSSLSSSSDSTEISINSTVQLRGITIKFCPIWTCKNRCFQKPNAAPGVSESPKVSTAVSSSLPAVEDITTTTTSENETEPAPAPCRCDHSCIRLGDCCVDFFSLCLNITDEKEVIRLVEHALYDPPTARDMENELQLNVTQLIVKYGSCITSPEGQKYTMISSCPETFADQTVVATCTQAEKHPNLQPYSGVDNMALTFRNLECARCHGYDHSKLLPWLQGVSCPNADADSSGQNSYLKDIAAAIRSGHCTYIYRAPEHTQTQPRSCIPLSSKLGPLGLDTATDANVSNADDVCRFEDMLLCKAYAYQTFTSDDEEVKNPHCLKCMTGSTPVSVELPCARAQNRSKDTVESSGRPGGILALFSRDSSGADTIVVNGQKIRASEILCKDDQVFDHVFLVCRTLFCPVGFRPIHGRCSLVDHYMVPAESQMVPKGTGTIYVAFDLESNTTCEKFGIEGTFRKAFQDTQKHLTVSTINVSCVPDQYHSLDVINKTSSEFDDQSVTVTIHPVSNLSKVLESLNYTIRTLNYVTRFVVKNYDTEPKPECTAGRPDLIHHANISKIDGNLFVKRSEGPQTLFYPLANTIFKIDLTKSNTSDNTIHLVYISLLCVQPQMNSSLNCSSVAFGINRTRVENGTLFITNTELSYPESQYEIHERFVLVCSDFENLNDFQFFRFSDAQYYLSWACSLTSVVFLMTSLVAFFLLPYLRNLAGHMTASLAASLALGQLLILVDFIPFPVLCSVLAAVCHFCWLAAFTWMTALAVHMTRTFFGSMATSTGKLKANEVQRQYKKYCFGGWGIPAMLVATLVTLDNVEDSPFTVGYGTPLCGWMRQSYVFLIPVAVALAFNVVCFLLTLVSIERTMRASRAALTRQQTSDRQRLLVYTKMMSAMGFTWIAGFLASFTKVAAFWWVYIVLNGLQGTFIAFSFVLNTRLLRFLKAEWSTARNSAASGAEGRGSQTGSELNHSGTRVSKVVMSGRSGGAEAGKGLSCVAGCSRSAQSLSGVGGGQSQ